MWVGFAGIENAEPSARSRTDVEEPAAVLQRGTCDIHRGHELFAGGGERPRHPIFFAHKQLDQLHSRKLVESSGARVSLLGGGSGEVAEFHLRDLRCRFAERCLLR